MQIVDIWLKMHTLLRELIKISAMKPNPFFWVEPNFGPKIWIESGQVGPQIKKTGPIGSGCPQIGVQPYNKHNKVK